MLQHLQGSTFKDAFRNALQYSLHPEELGSFIMVLANSLQNPQIKQRLWPALLETYQALYCAHEEHRLNGSPDDLLVFEKLLDSDLDHMTCWQKHTCGPWMFSINPIRKLRPTRQSTHQFHSLKKALKPADFHFDQTFLQPEIFTEEDWYGTTIRTLFHKYPFSPYQLLILPDPNFRLPQYLTREHHEIIWDLSKYLYTRIPGWGMAYNSLGAGASVNHLHFHSFIDTNPLPAELDIWRHTGGNQRFPVDCKKIYNQSQTWQCIEELHSRNQPYNLIYRNDHCLLFTRKAQGDAQITDWLKTAGWVEMSGAFNLTSHAELQRHSPESICRDLKTTRV